MNNHSIGDRLLRTAIIILVLIGLFLLLGCTDPRADERRQQTANSAATIYEAAIAIEQGAPVAAPAAAIKANASAIATAQGHPYPTPATAPKE